MGLACAKLAFFHPAPSLPVVPTTRRLFCLCCAGQHATVARATIYTLTPNAVTVSIRKPLCRGLLLPAEIANGTPTTQPPPSQQQPQQQQQQAAAVGNNGSGSGPVPMAVDRAPLAQPQQQQQQQHVPGSGSAAFDPSVRWRLDRDDISSTYTKLRANLFALFSPESERAARLRQLIIELAPPQQVPVGAEGAGAEGTGQEGGTAVDPTPAGMNHEQHVAVRRVLRARDYALVLGMPGAGKTTTIGAPRGGQVGGWVIWC